ncbi:hypothetical protein PIROE2DRAFT_8939, partial [Piromyces sp. E2]
INDSKYENIISQSSSIINIQSEETEVYIYDSQFKNVIYPFEISSKDAKFHCKNCIISDIKRDLAKNKPTIAQNSGDSIMYFNDTEIYNVKTSPLFKAIESSRFYFNSVSIHDIDSLQNVGLFSILTSSSVVFDHSKIYNIKFRRVLDNAYFINFASSSSLTIKDTDIYDIDIDGDFIYILSSSEDSTSLYIEDSTFRDFNIETGSIVKTALNKVNIN